MDKQTHGWKETERWTNRQRYRQTEWQQDGQTDNWVEGEREKNRQRGSESDTRIDRQTQIYRLMDGRTDTRTR